MASTFGRRQGTGWLAPRPARKRNCFESDILKRLGQEVSLEVTRCAVAAVLKTDDGRYLMQLRDDKEKIWFPNMWSMFGGLIEPEETPEDALKRELSEELDFQPSSVEYFTQIIFDASNVGLGLSSRMYFEVPITLDDIDDMVLHEGKGKRLFTPEEFLSDKFSITPYELLVMRLELIRRGKIPVPRI